MISLTKKDKLLLTILSIIIFISTLIPALVLSLIGNKQSTIIITISSLVFSWLILSSLIIFKKHKIIKSYFVLFISLPVFMYILELNTDPGTWFFKIALMAYFIGIVALGLIICIWTILKFKLLYSIFLTLLIASLTAFLENTYLIYIFGNNSISELRNLVAAIIALSSLPFLLLGIIVHKNKILKNRQTTPSI